MPRRAAPLESRLSSTERFTIGNALSFSPWKGVGPNDEPSGRRRYSDVELKAHWEDRASQQPPPGLTGGGWGERHWAYRRWVLGESAAVAFTCCRRLKDLGWDGDDSADV